MPAHVYACTCTNIYVCVCVHNVFEIIVAVFILTFNVIKGICGINGLNILQQFIGTLVYFELIQKTMLI